MSNYDKDQQAIVDAIAGETAAYYARDFERWSAHWLHDDCVRRLAVLAGGQMVSQSGWAEESSKMAEIMRDNPMPIQTATINVRREDMTVRVFGDMAWASFEQYTPRTSDNFVNVGLSHQIRIFEKHDGDWKIVFAGAGDTTTGYFDFPTISVDHTGTITWMNEAAKVELPKHPILMQSAGRLQGRRSDDNGVIKNAIRDVDALNAMDIRLSIVPDSNNKSVIPLVFDDPHDTISHVLWLAKIDGQIIVSFDDHASTERRLAASKELFGLSASQTRLASLILDGCDLVQAAAHMDISINTARTHLQRIFEKTGVRSQTALVRTLLSTRGPTS